MYDYYDDGYGYGPPEWFGYDAWYPMCPPGFAGPHVRGRGMRGGMMVEFFLNFFCFVNIFFLPVESQENHLLQVEVISSRYFSREIRALKLFKAKKNF